MVNYDPDLDPVLSDTIEILDDPLSQLQQPQINQIQQPEAQKTAQEQQQIPIPENLNSENNSESVSEQDAPMDLVFCISVV